MGMIGNSLAQGLVSGANIVDGTVDTADIKDAAVTPAKLSTGHPTWDSSGNFLINASGTPAAGAKMKIATSSRTGAFVDFTATGGENWIIDSTNTTGSTDVLGIYANGATGMYLTDAGNVGIGTSSPAAANKLQVASSTADQGIAVGGTTKQLRFSYDTTSNYGQINCADWGTGQTDLSIGGLDLLFKTGIYSLVERMRIDSSGNVGVGTASVASNTLRYLDVQNSDTGASAGAIVRLITNNVANSGVTSVDMVKYRAGQFYINNNETNSAAMMGFGIGGSEKGRFTQNGNLCVGYSGNPPDTNVRVYAYSSAGQSDTYGIILAESGTSSSSVCAKSTTGTTQLFQWGTLGCRIGSRIKGAGNAGDAYFTTGNDVVSLTIYDSTGNYGFRGSNVSDRRLKRDITDLSPTLSKVLSMAPKSYNMVTPNAGVDGADSEPQLRYGFIAQEMRDVEADVVTGNETEGYLGIDYNGVLAMAVKAIQEQQTIIEQLKSRIEILEAN